MARNWIGALANELNRRVNLLAQIPDVYFIAYFAYAGEWVSVKTFSF